MPAFLLKLAEDEYVEWSTIVDAPVTYIETALEAYERMVEEGLDPPVAVERIARADRQVTSAKYLEVGSVEEVLGMYRNAGDEVEGATLAEIREWYGEKARERNEEKRTPRGNRRR